jgi:hypothetical protein
MKPPKVTKEVKNETKHYEQLNIHDKGQFQCNKKIGLWQCQASSMSTMENYVITNTCICN